MKKSNSKIIRVPFDKGNYSTISNIILLNPNISSDAKVLLQLLLNNTTEWQVNLQFYSDKFKWNGQKQAKIIKELKDNGYLNVKRYSKGNKSGFTYFYTISEYGNLHKGEKQTSQLQPAIIEVEPSIPAYKNDAKDIQLYIEKVNVLISELSKNFTLDVSFSNFINSFLSDRLNSNEIDATQFVEQSVNDFLLKMIITEKVDLVKSIINEQKDNLHGNQAKQKVYINETPTYFKKLLESGTYLTDNEIIQKLSGRKFSILGTGAKNLPDYMD